MAKEGSNSGLKLFIERIETLLADKKAISEDISGIYKESKAAGFDVKAMRRIIQLRKQDAQEREAMEATIDSYKVALGMLEGTPLGKAAVERKRLEVAGTA